MTLKLMYITNDPDVALIAQHYGVDRIWVDLETLLKDERQKNMNTVKSKHCVEDIKKIAPILNSSEMLVRVNPWNDKSKNEIDQVIKAGADIIMLPMWKSVLEVKEFLTAVGSRVKTVLLLETKEAENCLDEILKLSGIDEIHIGLNDLHLSYGLDFMFELLSNGKVESICKKIKVFDIPYGFGGIAQLGEGLLPTENIILEHYRLGSTRAILSRSFCNTEEVSSLEEVEILFKDNMKKLREFEKYASSVKEEMHIENQKKVTQYVKYILKEKRRKTACS